MLIPQILYKIIYQRNINVFLRNTNKVLSIFLPKSIRIPPSDKIIINTESGKLIICTNQTSYLTQLLFWNGYKNFEYSEIFEELSKRVSLFLDIGSNIGYYSLLSVKSNPNIKVYAFEPALGPKHYLKKNIFVNGFENNITAIDTALSNKIGSIDFYEVENIKYRYLKYNLAGEGNAGTKQTSRDFIKNTVHSTTLKAYILSNNLQHIDLIKIDTEGTEIDILLSGKSEINKFKPIIICETLFDTIEGKLEDFFIELNYEMYNHTPRGLEKVETIQRNSDNYVRNCFFVPKSKIDLISDFLVKS